MKNIYDAMREKLELIEQHQEEVQRLNAEIRALQAIAPVLEEAGDRDSDAFRKYEQRLTATGSNGQRKTIFP
jgi:hypothetical protein